MKNRILDIDKTFSNIKTNTISPDWAIMGTKKACKTCGGFGTLGQIIKHSQLPKYAVREIRCPDCRGSGRLK